MQRWLTRGIVLCLLGFPGILPAVQGRLGVSRFPEDLAKELGQTAPGALIYWIAPGSPAKNAGLEPGDRIVAINGAPVASFDDLVGMVAKHSPGEVVTLDFARGSLKQSAKATLALWVSEFSDVSYRGALKFLCDQLPEHDSPELRHAIVNNHWLLGEREKAIGVLDKAIVRFPNEQAFKALRLDYLLKTGEYERYCREAIALGDAYPPVLELQIEKAEAFMATGRLPEAAALAKRIAIESNGNDHLRAIHREALQKWISANVRMGQPLVDHELDATIDPKVWDNPELAVAAYWRSKLKNAPLYQVTSGSAKAELELQRSSVLLGLVPNKMHGIAIKVNGVDVPLAIIDTGASHTLLSAEVASQAGVWIGTHERAAAGSLSFTARPGVIEELSIGPVKLRNIPVNVGNPPPLVMTKAKAALGIDLMHHLRFSIDYPNHKVTVRPANAEPDTVGEVWDIPLWTFTDHVLSVARTSKGGFARTLIDSGNFAQTLVWPQWAKQHVPNHPGAASSILVYGFRNPQRDLEGLELGGVKLPKWPIMDIPPITLQGIDLLDLLMGHDLLSQYRVSIDMRGRRLRLESPGGKLQKPKSPKPFMT